MLQLLAVVSSVEICDGFSAELSKVIQFAKGHCLNNAAQLKTSKGASVLNSVENMVVDLQLVCLGNAGFSTERVCFSLEKISEYTLHMTNKNNMTNFAAIK